MARKRHNHAVSAQAERLDRTPEVAGSGCRHESGELA
jgi:hypothetical protein